MLLANGKLAKITLPDQTHWILLSRESVTDGPVKLAGTSVVAKRWNDGRAEVTLLAAGKVECGQLTPESEITATKKR